MFSISLTTKMLSKLCIFYWLVGFKHFVAANAPKVYPVYPANESVDLVVSSMLKVKPQYESRNGVYQAQNRAFNSDFREDVYLLSQKEACRRNSIASCWTYNALSFVQNFLTPMPASIDSARSLDWTDDLPHLVGLPVTGNNSFSMLGRSSYWGLGDVYLFLEKQVSQFIQGHGIVLPAVSWDEAVVEEFYRPVVLEEDTGKELQNARASTQRKHKRKSVLFPLLILFKFFKIKMILVPILLTVLLVKKLLLAAFFLAPNLFGMLRCRPPFTTPPFGIASAGILQDVTDSRGEFSSLYNAYANPYRDYHGYRTRDLGRYQSLNQQQPAADTSPDYN